MYIKSIYGYSTIYSSYTVKLSLVKAVCHCSQISKYKTISYMITGGKWTKASTTLSKDMATFVKIRVLSEPQNSW